MPAQTTKGNILFPDGAKVQVKDLTTLATLDIGALNSAISLVLNYDENQVDTANFGKTDKQIKNMTIAGGFTLINMDLEAIAELGGGLFERVVTSAGAVAAIDNQVIATGWADVTAIALELVETGGSSFIPTAAPAITSVTGSVAGALTVNDDYTIIVDPDSPSGYSIILNTAGTGGVVTTETITIVYTGGGTSAQDSEVIYVGSSTKVLDPYGLIITHTDENGRKREVELYSVDANTGGFQFNFKGANEEGVEEMPVTFTGRIDTALTDGRQLLRYTMETGAL